MGNLNWEMAESDILAPYANQKSDSIARLARRMASVNREKVVVTILLVIPIAFNLAQLYPELTARAPFLNDAVLHLLAMGRTVIALLSGQDPTDTWLGTIATGYPLFHSYQHLPYILPSAIYLIFSLVLQQSFSLVDVYHWVNYLLLAFFPLSIYWSMRRVGFARLPSALSSLVTSLISTNGLYGFDLRSYVWSGYGLYTQLWGMFLLPIALAQSYCALREGRGYFWAVLLVTATVLSHVVAGYILLGSLVLLALLPALGGRLNTHARSVLWTRARRLVLVLILVAAAASYFIIPFILDSAFVNRSVWELPGKYDSYGAAWVLQTLTTGNLFDFGRLPFLTLLVFVGLIFCLWHWREERYRLPVVLFIAWLLLYFGRPTWGSLIDLLPMSRDLQLHRLIMGVHLGGLLLIGFGLAIPWNWALARRRAAFLLVPIALTALILLPVYNERLSYVAQNNAWTAQTQSAYAQEEKDIDALVQAINALPPGRVYAGLARNWGKDYRVGAVPMYAVLNSAGLDTIGYLYHALSLNSEVEPLFDDSQQAEYNLFNIRYIVTPVGWTVPSFFKPIGDFGRQRLYSVETTGYFDFIHSDFSLTGDKTAFYSAASQWLKSGEPKAKEHPSIFLNGDAPSDQRVLALAQAGSLVAQFSPAALPSGDRILSESVESNAYAADVVAERNSTLMLKVTFHPDWHAYVDGIEVKTTMLMPSYIGIEVPSGTHSVRFQYQPTLLRHALLLLGLIALTLTGLAEWRRRDLARLGRLLRQSFDSGMQTIPGELNQLPVVRALAAVLSRRAQPAKERPLVARKTMLGVYLLFFAIYLMSGAGHFSSTDHVAVYMTTQSLVENHSLAIKPIHDAVKGQDGDYYSNFGLGQALTSIPLYSIGKWVDSVAPASVRAYFAGANLGDWGGTVPIFFVSLFNQFITPLTCLLVLLFCLHLGFSFRVSFITTLTFGLSTAAWVYAREYFQHPLESLLLLFSVYILFANRRHLAAAHALFSGAALGFGILTRINLLFVAPVVSIYLFVLVYRRRPLKYLFAISLPIAAAFTCLLLIDQARYGDYLAFHIQGQAIGFSTPIGLGLYGNLLSVGRSIFLYSPPTLLALVTLRELYRQHRAEALLFLTIAGVYLAIYSTYGHWDGGWSYGPRFLVPLIPFLVIPLGYFLTNWKRYAIMGLFAIVGAGIQILGVTIQFSYVYWDWLRMNLTPDNAFLFIPGISAIPMHLQALLAGRYVDLWMVQVLRQFGTGIFLLTLLVLLAILFSAFNLLSDRESKEPIPTESVYALSERAM